MKHAKPNANMKNGNCKHENERVKHAKRKMKQKHEIAKMQVYKLKINDTHVMFRLYSGEINLEANYMYINLYHQLNDEILE